MALFQVNCKDMNEETFMLKVESTDTVQDVLSQFKENYPDEQLRLVFQGEELDGNCTLPDCGVSEGDTVLLLERLNG